MTAPFLSIVIPTREGLSEHWFTELFKVEGNIEFLLVHPPGTAKYPYSDNRLQQIISPFRGEIIQRMTGLMTASGAYTLSVNCDEYLHPKLLEVTTKYFQRFPESWLMRLSVQSFTYGQLEGIIREWTDYPDIDSLAEYSLQEIREKKKIDQVFASEKNYLMKIPIAPLDNPFSFQAFRRNRRDQHGSHTENFDKKVWRTSLMKETLLDLTETMELFEPIKYIPFWCLDRLLGLYLQAKFFDKKKENERFIGHLLPAPELLRIEDNPPQYSRKYRWFQLAEMILVKRFPQYGYCWNLVIENSIDLILGIIKQQISNFLPSQDK
ncbi:MAG: glycosyltransferase [Microcystaceae cyanobacterium]